MIHSSTVRAALSSFIAVAALSGLYVLVLDRHQYEEPLMVSPADLDWLSGEACDDPPAPARPLQTTGARALAATPEPERRPARRHRLPHRDLDLLGSADPHQRCRGVRALEDKAALDTEARDAIRRALRDADSRVRIEALQTLIEIEDRSAVSGIRKLLDDPEPSVRGEAIGALVELAGDPESGAIAELLNDRDAEVRADAAAALGSLSSQEELDLLVSALSDADEDVRDQALHSIDRLHATAALPALAALHDASEGALSFRLLETMRRLGDSGPYHREIDRLAQIALSNDDAGERCRAIRTLERRARSEARAVFRRALMDPSPRVRRSAARALR